MRTLILTYPTEIDDEAPLEGKFLQLRWAGRAYLLFASADEHRYHNQILGRFLSEQGIPHRWEGAENLVVDHPELSITGGGRFRLDLPTKQLAGVGCVQRLRSLRCVCPVSAARRCGSALAGARAQRRLSPNAPR